MNHLIYSIQEKFVKRTKGFRVYLLFINFVVLCAVAALIEPLEQGHKEVWDIIFFTTIFLTSMFFGFVVGSFFKDRTRGIKFVYLMFFLLLIGIPLMNCTYTDANNRVFTEVFGMRFFW